jgi:DNA-directed RNA polymerase subunit RPC12/RpoP
MMVCMICGQETSLTLGQHLLYRCPVVSQRDESGRVKCPCGLRRFAAGPFHGALVLPELPEVWRLHFTYATTVEEHLMDMIGREGAS